MPTRFTLIRHGQTAWNASGRWQGHAPVPLDDEGRRQARLLAAHLAPTNDAVAIVASDLSRAAETAELVAGPLRIPVTLDPRLREVDVGDWQGLNKEEVRTWDRERFLAIDADPFEFPRPGGECGRAVALRALAALEDIALRHAGSHVLVVSHGGTIRNLLRLLAIPVEEAVVGNTSCTVLVHEHHDERQVWSLDVFNMTAHLDGALLRTEIEP